MPVRVDPRLVKESQKAPIEQGINEAIAYVIDMSPHVTAPATATTLLYELIKKEGRTEYKDVTSTHTSGSNDQITGDDVTTKLIQSLEEGKTYRCEVRYTKSGNTKDVYFYLLGVR